MIEFINVSKSFFYKKTETKALDEVTIQIEDHKMVAIMGPSGSGKSTLLNIAGGIFEPSNGEYLFDHKPVLGNDSYLAKFRSDHIGFILQHFALINNRTVFYNIALPLHYKNIEKSTIKKKVLETAKSLGIDHKLNMYPHMLSGGECQRVAISRAVISNPKVILADEPTSALDTENSDLLITSLQNKVKTGTTVILVTHDMDIANSCDRIIKIKDGHIDAD